MESVAIWNFLKQESDTFRGDVLDYGCGSMRYRPIVERAGGKYWAWDDPKLPDHNPAVDPYSFSRDPIAPVLQDFDCILCTQVLSLVVNPFATLTMMLLALQHRRGSLVLTVPCTWPQFHTADRWRWTSSGIQYLVESVGFEITTLRPTWQAPMLDLEVTVGYGVIAHAR